MNCCSYWDHGFKYHLTHGCMSMLYKLVQVQGQSWWPCNLRHRFEAACLWDCGFESCWGHGSLFLVYVACCVGSCLCDGLIKCWAGSYWVCMWCRNLKRWGLGPIWTVGPQKKKMFTHCLLKTGWTVQIGSSIVSS